MAKLVNVTIDLESGQSTIDLIGFHGKGCADVLKAFDSLGTRTKEVSKPEMQESTPAVQRR